MTDCSEHKLKVQQLFIRYQGRLRAFALAICPDFASVDDLMQEAFLTVSAKAAEFDLQSNFLAWSRSIVRFKMHELGRSNGTRLCSSGLLESIAASCPDDWGGEEKIALLSKCLSELAPKAKEVIALRYQREHSPTEIASMLSRTVSSINVALSKARVALRECLDRKLAAESMS